MVDIVWVSFPINLKISLVWDSLFLVLTRNEIFTEKEIEQAIYFATYLFWEDESDTRLYEEFINDFDIDEKIVWETEIDGIYCRIIYNPDAHQPKCTIAFLTDIEAQKATQSK